MRDCGVCGAGDELVRECRDAGDGRVRNRAAGGLRAGPERRDEALGSLVMKIGSVMCVLFGEAGRDDGGEQNEALGSAIFGSMLGTVSLKWRC